MNTLLHGLVAVVQVRGNTLDRNTWETIAAFDLKVMAEEYAKRCRDNYTGTLLTWRVVMLEDE